MTQPPIQPPPPPSQPPGGSFPAAPPPGPSGPGQSIQQMGKGLFGSLFDFSFRHFATPHIVRIVYILAVALIGIGALGAIVTAFALMGQRQAASGLFLLIATPIGALFYLALIRMTMELYVAVTRSAEEVSRIREQLNSR